MLHTLWCFVGACGNIFKKYLIVTKPKFNEYLIVTLSNTFYSFYQKCKLFQHLHASNIIIGCGSIIKEKRKAEYVVLRVKPEGMLQIMF